MTQRLKRQARVWTTLGLVAAGAASYSAVSWGQRFPTNRTLSGSVKKWTKRVDTTPPRITSITPSPADWVVNNLGLEQIQIGFSEPVMIPPGSIMLWTLAQGDITDAGSSYDDTANTLTISLNAAIRDDRLTLVVDYTITDVSGNAFDGEIGDPVITSLPSGNGKPAGQAVFRFNILQGDANRDGIVDAADAAAIQVSLGKCTSAPGFNPNADLNRDGCVNVLDVSTFTLAQGRVLPTTDGFAPFVIQFAPEPTTALAVDFSTVLATFSEPIDPLRFNLRTCYVVDSSGVLTIPSSATLAPDGLSATYDFSVPLSRCSSYSLNFSNALADPSGSLLTRPSTLPVVSGLLPPAAPTVGPHPSSSNAPEPATITINGTAPSGSSVEIVGHEGTLLVPTTAGAFTADVPLTQNRINHFFFTTIGDCGAKSSVITRAIRHDAQAPSLFIDYPIDGAQITTPATDVAGRVGDILSGFVGLTVSVNGVSCVVDQGIGTNGTFVCSNIPLTAGTPTSLQATAIDVLGNETTKEISVTRTSIPPNSPQMLALTGNAQSASVGNVLAQPIVVRVTRADGTAFANKVVTFNVTRSDARLGATPQEITPSPINPDPGKMMFQARADANGDALAYWRLGSDAGCGNNRVEATSRDIAGTVAFCASASAGPGTQVNVGMGNNQRAEVGGLAPEPLRVWVSDGVNGAEGVPVTFSVIQGLGKVYGQNAVTINTNQGGYAEVLFQAGPESGNNLVEATFPGNTAPPGAFFVIGLIRNLLEPTRFSGIVLNNANQPIEGVKCTLDIPGQSPRITYSDASGRFFIDNVLGAGHADLYADGSTATAVNGLPIIGERYPFLHFEPLIIPNAENSIGMPLFLPPLRFVNDKVFDNTQDVELTLEGMEGLKMIVRAGSMTRANGTVPTPQDPATLSLNQVHYDDIPMPLPDGALPFFAWTLQPGGSRFDPPVEIIYPNMTARPPGAIGYFLSFNHDTNRFEIVASGHVVEDGSVMVTDPGAGISNAGWGGATPPTPITGTGQGGCPPSTIARGGGMCGCSTNEAHCNECEASGPRVCDGPCEACDDGQCFATSVTFLEAPGQSYGFDNFTNPATPSKSVGPAGDTVLLISEPPLEVFLSSTETSVGFSPLDTSSPDTLVTLLPVSFGPTTIEVSTTPEGSPCTSLQAIVYPESNRRVTIVVVNELNEDTPWQPLDPPNPVMICVEEGPSAANTCFDLAPSPDDIVDYPYIRAGNDLTCNTPTSALTYTSDSLSPTALSQFLNGVYAQAVLTWSVEGPFSCDVDFDLNCSANLDIGASYTAEHLAIITECGDHASEHVLFLVNARNDTAPRGQAVPNSKWLFVYPDRATHDNIPNALIYTCAHELGHGVGSWPDLPDDRSNLMHAGLKASTGEAKLRRQQWDILPR